MSRQEGKGRKSNKKRRKEERRGSPWLATSDTLSTDFGIGISKTTFSMTFPMVCFGPTVMSSLPPIPSRKEI